VRPITIQDAADCIRNTLPCYTPDIWVLTHFRDYVNNNTEVEDMEESEFFESFLPCALWAWTTAMYDKMMPVVRSEEQEKANG
jgi:hypothetical protein